MKQMRRKANQTEPPWSSLPKLNIPFTPCGEKKIRNKRALLQGVKDFMNGKEQNLTQH